MKFAGYLVSWLDADRLHGGDDDTDTIEAARQCAANLKAQGKVAVEIFEAWEPETDEENDGAFRFDKVNDDG